MTRVDKASFADGGGFDGRFVRERALVPAVRVQGNGYRLGLAPWFNPTAPAGGEKWGLENLVPPVGDGVKDFPKLSESSDVQSSR